MPSANEHVLEIRYQPSARVLDHRGRWAETISTTMNLPRWQIVDNRVDVFDADKTRSCFLSFHNLGIVALDTATRNYFPDQAGKFIKAALGLAGFMTKLPTLRIGVRSRFCDPFEGSFDNLLARFLQRYMSVTDQAQAAIGANAQLVDIGAPLNHRDQLGAFNTSCGPMRQNEFARFFQKDEGFPAVGLFYDIDYFREPKAELKADELVQIVTQFAGTAWDRHERIRNLILGA